MLRRVGRQSSSVRMLALIRGDSAAKMARRSNERPTFTTEPSPSFDHHTVHTGTRYGPRAVILLPCMLRAYGQNIDVLAVSGALFTLSYTERDTRGSTIIASPPSAIYSRSSSSFCFSGARRIKRDVNQTA